jgi:hypothetical protein
MIRLFYSRAAGGASRPAIDFGQDYARPSGEAVGMVKPHETGAGFFRLKSTIAHGPAGKG